MKIILLSLVLALIAGCATTGNWKPYPDTRNPSVYTQKPDNYPR